MRLLIYPMLAMLAVAASQAAAGLVTHLPFNGNLFDETTIHNGLSVADPVFDAGVEGEALIVRSADAAVEIAKPQTLDFGNNFTVSAWVNTTYPGEQVVIYRGDPARFTSPALQINVQGPKFFIYGDSQGSFGADFSPAISVNDGTWHQIAVTYSAATIPHLILYLDGNAKKPGDSGTFFAGDFVTRPNKTNSVVRVGGRDAESGAYHFNGLIDDVQIYDRTLTGDQIKTLFASPGVVLPLPLIPAIIVQPVALQAAAIGSTVSFSVQAESRNAISYQWQLNGTNQVGATNATLTLANLSLSQAGLYTVVVSNSSGAVTSNPAKLVVGGAPELSIKMYPGITIKGTAGLKYRIDFEEAIGPTNNWRELTNLVLAADQSLVLDLQTTNTAKRVYRAVLPP